MAKKAASTKVILSPKATKATSDVEVIEAASEKETKISQEQIDALERQDVDAILDEELTALIEQGMKLYEELTGKQSWVPRVVMFEELENALLTRNKANRYADPKVIGAYTNRFLTNRKDETGDFSKGTIRWERDLPAVVMLSEEEGNLHNGQKCILSHKLARQTLRDDKKAIADKKKAEDYEETRGITLEMIDNAMTALIVQDIPESAADYVDTAQQRTNTDLLFRRHVFNRFDYKGMIKNTSFKGTDSNEVIVEKKHKILDKFYQEQSKLMATVLNFIARRLWDDGKPPRSTPSYGSEFSQDMLDQSYAAFPGVADSVNYVWRILKKERNTTKKFFDEHGLSIQYLTTVHYLASMHDATWNAKLGLWEPSEDGPTEANQWFSMLYGKDKKAQIVNWLTACKKMKDSDESKSDSDLNNIFNSLIASWRVFQFGVDSIGKAPLRDFVTSQQPYMTTSEDSDDQEVFDHVWPEDKADAAEQKLEQKQKHEEAKEGKPAAAKKPPVLKKK